MTEDGCIDEESRKGQKGVKGLTCCNINVYRIKNLEKRNTDEDSLE